MTKKYFECQYCLKKYVNEGSFKKHVCEPMIREQNKRTTSTVTAFNYYNMWLNGMGKRSQTLEVFLDSKYYTSFIKFVKFTTRMMTPRIDIYIKVMIKRRLLPMFWCNKTVYQFYLDKFDVIFPPDEQIQISIETLTGLARIFDCKTADIFNHIRPFELIRLIQTKRLSPWLLLCSSKFKKYITYTMNPKEHAILDGFIDARYWKSNFTNSPDDVDMAKRVVKKLGI